MMPYRNPNRRKAIARLRYRNDAATRNEAKARAKRQRERCKIDLEYREKRNGWQRRYRRKRAAQHMDA